MNMLMGSSSTIEIEGAHYVLSCISVQPLILYVPNLLTSAECASIIERSTPTLQKSYVMGGVLGLGGSVNESNLISSTPLSTYSSNKIYRSSLSTWLSPDNVTRSFHHRIAKLTGLPLPYLLQKSEDLQVVKYERAGQFNVHHDSSAFHPRLLTALVYLNNVTAPSEVASDAPAVSSMTAKFEHSGGTWFPLASTSSYSAANNSNSSSYSASTMTLEEAVQRSLRMKEELHEASANRAASQPQFGLVVRPRLGAGIIFFNHDSAGSIDPFAVHAGLPVGLTSKAETGIDSGTHASSGECVDVVDGDFVKWVANYWIQYDESLLNDFMQ